MNRITLEAELIPLWIDSNKLYRPYGWQSIDFSTLDWSAPYKDYSKKKDSNFMRPFPNTYGVRGGKTLSIIDIDNKTPGLADETLHKLRQLGLDTNTFTVKSKSGGYHLYYNRPSYPVKTCTGHLFSNVDIRGDDGYVIGPDTSLSEWTEGKYVIMKAIPVIDCTLELPAKRAITNLIDLPTITEKIPHGSRDSTMLYYSGKWVAEGLSDKEIAAEFALLEFEAVDGDTPELSDMMLKVNRDRLKTADIMQYTLERFIFMECDSKIYDIHTGAYNIIANMELNFPLTIMVSTGTTVKPISVLREWIKHPDRTSVWGIGFKPAEEDIFTGDDDKLYFNSYEPVSYKPWDEPVQWDDPDLSNYRAMIENLCSDNVRTLDMVNSQRAAKVQNLLWTPHWGFVIISTKYRIGKDFSFSIFSRLLGVGHKYFKEAEISDIKAGRNEYLNESMTVMINEPGGLKDNFSSNTVLESIKKLFSESLITVKMLYSARTNLIRTYRIPEIHSNYVDAIKLHESNKRFAPIVCNRGALNKSVYSSLGKQLDDPQSVFLRKLKRFYLDYSVSPDITEVEAPKMVDQDEIINSSRGDDVIEFEQMIQDAPTLFQSDIQTDQSIVLGIMTHMGLNQFFAKKLWRIYRKDTSNYMKIGRHFDMPVIEYDVQNIISTERRICKIKTTTSTGKRTMCTTYAIRDWDIHNKRKSENNYINEHFFPDSDPK